MRFCGHCGAAAPTMPSKPQVPPDPQLRASPPVTAISAGTAGRSLSDHGADSQSRLKHFPTAARIKHRYAFAVAAVTASVVLSIVGAALFDIHEYERASDPLATAAHTASPRPSPQTPPQPVYISGTPTIATHGCRHTTGGGLAATVCGAQSVTLPVTSGEYFYVGATAGGAQMFGVNWTADLNVIAQYSGNLSVVIGHSRSNVGQYQSAVGNYAIGGATLSGYSAVDAFQASSNGTTVTLRCVVPGGDNAEILLIGGEGTGITGVSAKSLFPLENVTYSEGGGDVIASTGIFMGTLPPGAHTITITSHTYPSNSGTALGAVLYVLQQTVSK